MFILSNYYIEIGILLLLLITIIVYITKYFDSAKFVRKAGKVPITKDGWLISGVDIELRISDIQLNAARLGITIGRSAKLSELLVNDNSVSCRHARISYIKNDLYIEDLSATRF